MHSKSETIEHSCNKTVYCTYIEPDAVAYQYVSNFSNLWKLLIIWMENNKGDRILAKLVIFSIVRIINEREAHGPISSFGLFWTCDIQNDATEIVWSVGVFVGRLFVDTTQFILKATATKKGLEHSNKAMEKGGSTSFLRAFTYNGFVWNSRGAAMSLCRGVDN